MSIRSVPTRSESSAARTAAALAVASCLALLVFSPSALGQEPGDAPQETEREGVEKREPAERPLPELPPEKLPKRTGEPPDPAKEQLVRGKVYVTVTELVQPREGDVYEPEVPVLQNYLAEYFRRAGWSVTTDPAEADFLLAGDFRALFKEKIEFRETLIGLRFDGAVRVDVNDPTGKSIDVIDIPSHELEASVRGLGVPGGRKPGEHEEKNVILDLRRELAKIVWQDLFYRVGAFTDPEVPALLSSLAVDDLENEEPVNGNEVLAKLVSRGLEAVPYLLDALSDERQVMVSMKYPGITALNTEKLRLYHVADKALEEVFQKVSRMDLDTPRKHRFLIIRGWEQEWRRFCPSYRESPHAPDRAKTEADDAEAAATKSDTTKDADTDARRD